MSQNRYYNILIILGFMTLYMGFIHAVIHKPKGDEDNIKLNIRDKERIYYELDDNGLFYKGVGKQFKSEDSIRIGFHSRTIKAPTGKKNRNYGFTIQIDDGEIQKLKYKKPGSKVTSKERPGWNYTESGIWSVYLPAKKEGYNIKIEPLKGNPVVYVRLTSNDLIKDGKFSKIIKTVNHQDRWRIQTQKEISSGKDVITKLWYYLQANKQLQYEIWGPTTIRVFTRVQFENSAAEEDYYIRIREDGYDLGTFYFQSERSEQSYVAKTKKTIGKWRSVWLNVPKGRHYYTFTLPNTTDDNLKKSVFIRIKEWEETK